MKRVFIKLLMLLSLTGCTTLITAPIEIAGAVAGTAIDVGVAGVRAVSGD
jgi:uncharacterized protein YceK